MNNMDEKNRALMEAHQIASEDAYFAARPKIDCNDRRKVFEAGFRRGWLVGAYPGSVCWLELLRWHDEARPRLTLAASLQ